MMQPKQALITLLALLISAFAGGQGVIKGKVTDRETGEPLPGVYVITGTGKGTMTGSNGEYVISTDSVRLRITYQILGYQPVSHDISIAGREEVLLDVALEPQTMLLDQVLVSADRIEQKAPELVVSANVIKADFINRRQITDAMELITKTPGIEVLDGQASIRGGSGFSYGVGSRVLALVDGLPLLSGDAGGIRWQYLPMENISQVEIIKGASSVMYGSSALNGIINFRTADAGNIPLTSFFTDNGLYLKPTNRDWVWWSTPRVFSTTSFMHLRRAGNTDIGFSFSFFTDNSYRKYNDEMLGKASLRLKHFSKKLPGLAYGINLTAGLTSKTDFILWKDAGSALEQDTSSVSALDGRYISADPFISWSKSGRFRHDLRMRIQFSENRFEIKKQNDARVNTIYSEYQSWYRISGKLTLTSGLAATINLIDSRFFGDHRGVNLAAFTQAELHPVERLKLLAGLRIEENILDSEADKPVPVLRTGVNWQAFEFTYVRASFGQGYRFPSIAEKHASTTLGSVTIFPNPLVEAESGWSSEAGIKQGIRLGAFKGQADLSLFMSQSRNMIEYLFALYPEGLGFRAENLEKSKILGMELEFLLNRKKGNMNTMISGGYTFLSPVDVIRSEAADNTVFLKYRRKHSGKVNLSHEWKKFEIDAGFLFRSKTLNIDDVFVNPLTREQILPGFFDYWTRNNKGYFILDAGAGYRINSWLKISVTVRNLTNTEYMGRPADIQPPRSISVRLSGKFQ